MNEVAIAPPRSLEELMTRARALEGQTLGALAARFGRDIADDTVHAKGKLGELLERALGATGGSRMEHDFPELGVELKSVPVDARGQPLESTYVCKIQLEDADHLEWDDSWVKKKLSCVLFVPVRTKKDSAWRDCIVMDAVLFRPSDDDARTLRADFEEAMGLVAIGRVEELTAHTGTFLQVRPKARDGAARTQTFGPERERIMTMPRGFYLRPSFTKRILAASPVISAPRSRR